MRAVVTRVSRASVTVDGAVRGRIGRGFLVLLGVTHTDTEAQARKLSDKICSLRLSESGGALLIVSQFTLYGSCRHGRRPDFLSAARPEIAQPLYERFAALCAEKGFAVETGEFGAEMQVDSLNDGPLTLILDTDAL